MGPIRRVTAALDQLDELREQVREDTKDALTSANALMSEAGTIVDRTGWALLGVAVLAAVSLAVGLAALLTARRP